MKSKLHKPFYFQKKVQIVKALLYRGNAQERLFKYAQQVRDEVFSKKVEVRSVIEYSNSCEQACNFCGINKHSGLERYILSDKEFLDRVDRLYNYGRRVIMIQAGEVSSENYFERLFNLLKRVKDRYLDLNLICSLGNLSFDKYKKLRDIGIERYLLKFETSDPLLYKKIKPSDNLKNRLAHIKILKRIGFQVSSGNITGLPGETVQSLANDLLLLKGLDLPMGSTSIFIPNDLSAYANFPQGDIGITLNFMAILRIMCPGMVIPTTSSMELVKKGGQYLGLLAGANAVTLHDGTPKEKERKYVIYKRNRFLPKDSLFNVIKKAGLEPSSASLIRDKFQDTLFYKLINKNLEHKKTAVYFENHKYTYDDLFVLTSKFCSFLKKNNIKEGQIAILAVFDSIEFIVAFLSCIRLGIIVVPVDPQLNKEEWRLILSDTHPQYILATQVVCKGLSDKRVLKIADDGSSKYFFSLITKYNKSDAFAGTDKNNPAMILYTSGTTGKPKGVIHAYKDLFVDNFPKTILKINPKDNVFSCSKMYTSFGLGNSLFFPFHFGASVILSRAVPNHFSLQKVLRLKPTLFFAVPSMYDYLLSHRKTLKKPFKCVRIFISSGEKLYGDIFKKWRVAYKSPILECFGSTEMFHPFISNILRKEMLDSCGKVVKGFKIKLDKTGHIFYKGPSLTAGYYGDKRLTRQKIANGWFKSDDIGYINRQGYIFLKGRGNLVVKLSGKWVSIVDIESTLRKCRLVKEIAVINKKNGLEYYLTLNKTTPQDKVEKQIRRCCIENLKIHEFPKKIYVVEEMPKIKSGKIDRRRLETEGVQDEKY